MLKLYSKSCENALRAVLVIMDSDKAVKVEEIGEKTSLKIPFTRKALQKLSHAGILSATPGPNGGYTLNHNPKEISIMDIVHAIDGVDNYNTCVMGFSQCSQELACPMHDTWSGLKVQLIEKFEKLTLHDLSLKVSPQI